MAVSPVDLQRVLVLIEHPARTHLVGGHQVEFLALQLFLRVVRQIVGFGGKAGDVELGLGGAYRADHIGGALQLQHQLLRLLLDFAFLELARAVVGNRGAAHEDVRFSRSGEAGLQHLRGGFHVAALHPGRRGQGHRPGDQLHPRAQCGQRLRQGEAHFSGRAVAEHPHRIDRFPGGAGVDRHPHAGQRPGRQAALQLFADLQRLTHAPSADFTAGLVAGLGADQLDSALLQGGDIGLGGRVGPHQAVHRRRHENRLVAGQTQRAEQIGSGAVGEPGQKVGTGGRHQDQIRPARQFYVAHRRFCGFVPEAVAHRPATEGLEGQRGDELLGTFAHHHLHISAHFLQAPGQVRGLVGGDAAGDAQQHAPALQGRCPDCWRIFVCHYNSLCDCAAAP